MNTQQVNVCQPCFKVAGDVLEDHVCAKEVLRWISGSNVLWLQEESTFLMLLNILFFFFNLLLDTNEQLEGQRLIVFREELRIFIYIL